MALTSSAGWSELRNAADAQQPHRVDLILHQGDQRNAAAVSGQRRYLIAQGFASTGWHQHQGIITRNQGLYDLVLWLTKGVGQRFAAIFGLGLQGEV